MASIRTYQAGDQAQIVALFDEFQAYLVSLDPLRRIRALQGYGGQALQETLDAIAAHEGILYVAEADKMIVGFGVGIVNRPSLDERLWLIPSSRGRVTELYVRASHRGQGVGKQLMQQLEAYFGAQGCDVIRVEVFVPNESAHRFYQSLGYEDRDIDMIRRISRR